MSKYDLSQFGDYKKKSDAYQSIRSRRKEAEKAYDSLVESVNNLEKKFVDAVTENAEGKGNADFEAKLKTDYNLAKVQIQTAAMELAQLQKAEDIAKQRFDEVAPEAHQAACAAALKDFTLVFKKLIGNFTEASKLHQKIRDIYNELGETNISWNLLSSIQNIFFCVGRCDLGAPDQQGSMLSEIIRWAKDKEILD
jgi:tetratricopeptide (TPR) repeat protein